MNSRESPKIRSREYGQILRPHISLGRYRSAGQDPEEFVGRLAATASHDNVKWALTGSAGAYELERFYRGEETSVFVGVEAISDRMKQNLKLLPDRHGPIALFKLFGDIVLWPDRTGRPIAHPWLLYAELLHQGDARSLEAAEDIRQKYLEK